MLVIGFILSIVAMQLYTISQILIILKINNNTQINGIKLDETEIKINQFTDDSTFLRITKIV